MNPKIKISQLPAKGANLGGDDLIEVAEFTGTGYVSKSITGQELIDAIPAPSVEWGEIGGTLSAQTDLQTALNAKQDTLVSGTNIKTIEGQSLLGSGNIDLTKSDVGLGNVDNTSDANKPISTATQTALNAKQNSIFVARSFTQSIGSNSTGETQLLQITIPANSFSATDKLSFFATFSKTGTAHATVVRVKLSTSASMPSGNTGAVAFFTSTTTAQFIKLNRDMSISGGNLKGFPFTTSGTTDQVASTSTASISVAFDVTQTQYLYVSAQPSALTTDVTYLEAFEIKNL